MSYDRNPKFGEDRSFVDSAKSVTDLLWETAGGDLSAFPRSYLETLRHEFAEGTVSMLEVIDRVDLGPDAAYEDYCEVVEALLEVDPNQWPNPEDIQVVHSDALLFEIEPDYDFSEFDFAEEIVEEEAIVEEGAPDPMSEKMELFLKKVISAVYTEGVTDVTDMEGNPPASANNYLLADDVKSFNGIFYNNKSSQGERYPFSISEGEGGTWSIKY